MTELEQTINTILSYGETAAYGIGALIGVCLMINVLSFVITSVGEAKVK
jgi:hypothetical protein